MGAAVGGAGGGQEGSATTMATRLFCLHLCDQKEAVIRDRFPIFGGQGSLCTLAPVSCLQAVPGTHAQVLDTCLMLG